MITKCVSLKAVPYESHIRTVWAAFLNTLYRGMVVQFQLVPELFKTSWTGKRSNWTICRGIVLKIEVLLY